MNRFYRLALATFLSSLLLVAIGSLARLQIAGAGCGNDWPLCNGGWLPHRSWPSLVEYVHRLVALTTMLLSGLTALATFRASTASTRSRLLAVASFAAILAQSGFGGFTARLGAPAPAATLHLATAMIYLALAAAAVARVAAARAR